MLPTSNLCEPYSSSFLIQQLQLQLQLQLQSQHVYIPSTLYTLHATFYIPHQLSHLHLSRTDPISFSAPPILVAALRAAQPLILLDTIPPTAREDQSYSHTSSHHTYRKLFRKRDTSQRGVSSKLIHRGLASIPAQRSARDILLYAE